MYTLTGLSALALLAGAGGVASQKQNFTSQCCQNLSKAKGLEGKVHGPDTDEYQARLDAYWSVSAALPAWCMVVPESAEDVSAAIVTLVEGNCSFGIKGGGHGAHKLSNGVEHGVTIDFAYMNSTTYDTQTKLASIEPGGHWQTVYDELSPHGVVVTGGRAGTVGTGGFLTGGGNSFHSASHGMACDNVANFEIVLHDGSIVNANASSHPDLWRSLKGGSGNFGLITRFDMYTIDFPDPDNPVVWGGNLFYELEHGDEVIDALVDFTENVHKDENSSSIVYWAYLPKLIGGTMINAAIENTKAIEKPPAFDGYYTVPGIYDDTTKTDTISVVANELGAGQPAGYRNVWFAASFKNDPRPMRHAVKKFDELNKALEAIAPSDQSDVNTLCMFQPITKSIVEKGEQLGGNVLGLENYVKDGNGIMFLVTLAINGYENEVAATPLVQAYVEELDAYSDSLGLKWDWKYLNYAHKSQDAIASYGKESVDFMRKVSAEYDPEGVFQKLRGSGFKIPQKDCHRHREL